MTRSVATLLAATFFCPTAAAAFYANPDADVQIVGLPEQVYAGGESFFIVVLANDQPFFDESLDEEGAVGVRLNVTNGIVTAIEGSTFETNTSVGHDNITLYQDYISEWNCTLAVVRFAPTGAGDAVHINASGWIKDKDKPLFSDRYVATDADSATSEIIDYSNICDVSTLSELALKRKAFYNNSIKMLGAINGATAMDSNINAAWLGAIVYTGSLAYSIKGHPVTIPGAAGYALEQSLNGYTDVTNPGGTFGGYGFNLLTSSVNNMLQAMKTEMDYGGDIGNAINAMQDMELALDDESGKWGARDAAGLQFILGENARYDWQRGEKGIMDGGDMRGPVRGIHTTAQKKIDAGTANAVDVYACHVSTTILEFIDNDYDYVTKVIELPVDSNGNGLFDFEERAEPIPSLTNLEPSVEIAVGETRDLVFTLTNAGNDSDVGYLDLSVSSGIEIVANSSDAADMLTYTLAPGEDAFFSDGYEHPLTYSLFGAYKPYAEGESVTVTITIRASAAGEEWLKYRLSMMNSSGEYIRIPNAGVKDQQGWYAHETTVTVIDPANVAPAADAGCDQEVSEGTAVTLNGSGSSDTDGAVVEYIWREGGSVIGTGAVIGRMFDSGTHTVVLTVTDDGGKSDSDTVVVAVTANAAPVADAGANQSVASGVVVTLDGSGSSDSDGTIEYYEWQEGGEFLGSGATLETVFAPGVHEVTLYVVDCGGKVGSDVVRVEIAASGVVPEEEWNVTFGGSGWDRIYSIQQTTDDGYVLAGCTESYGAGYGDFWLIKTDSEGNEQWNKTFGGTNSDAARSVQQTSDGGYILAGYTYSYGAGYNDVWIVKTDSNGNEQWNKTFGGTGWDIANSVQQTSCNSYIIAGYTGSYGAGDYDVWLIKTDSDGNEVWNKTFGGIDGDEARSVQITADGGYIIAGYTSYGVGGYDVWLIKTDSDGSKEWDKTFGGTYDDKAYSVQQTTDGGYILAGSMEYGDNDDVWLVKTDSDGNKEWDKTFGGTDYWDDDYAYSVQQTIDGGYIIAGYTESYGMGDDAWLIRTYSRGKEAWNKTFGGRSGDYAYSVQITADGGYVLAGYTYLYDADGWLIKVKGDGMLNNPPLANFTYSPKSINVNETVIFDASNSIDSDGTIEKYEWEFWFGDVDDPTATTATGITTTCVYHSAGSCAAMLTVTDDDGATDSVTKYIYVDEELAPDTEWSVMFGGTDLDVSYSVQQTADGGYIVVGETNSYGAGCEDAWLVKTDSGGNKEWGKTFGGTISDGAYSVQQTSDGGYILAGYTWSYGDASNDFWLVKTDSDGNEEWDRTFGGTCNDRAYYVQQTADGGYILAGYTWSYGAGNRDFWIVKTDSNGNKQWDKTFGGTDYDVAQSIQQTMDDGYILAGYTKSYGAGDYDAWLVKIDSGGNKQWDQTFGGTDEDVAFSVQQTTDGGYIVAGYTESYGCCDGWHDFWVLKTDPSGNEQWNRTFGRGEARYVQQTTDGGYIIAGSWIMKTDSNGNAQWNKTSFCDPDYILMLGAYSVQQTTDGGYILPLGGYGIGDFWLIKLGPAGGTTDTTPPTLTITSPAPNTTTHSPTITIAGTASDTSGIASVTVNGEPANGTLNWSANVTLSEGENLITVVATDNEGNTATEAVTVRYEPLRGDLNRDGALTTADAAIALEIAAGSRPCDAAMLDTADVSGDNRVTSLDALMILQAAADAIIL